MLQLNLSLIALGMKVIHTTLKNESLNLKNLEKTVSMNSFKLGYFQLKLSFSNIYSLN